MYMACVHTCPSSLYIDIKKAVASNSEKSAQVHASLHKAVRARHRNVLKFLVKLDLYKPDLTC